MEDLIGKLVALPRKQFLKEEKITDLGIIYAVSERGVRVNWFVCFDGHGLLGDGEESAKWIKEYILEPGDL